MFRNVAKFAVSCSELFILHQTSRVGRLLRVQQNGACTERRPLSFLTSMSSLLSWRRRNRYKIASPLSQDFKGQQFSENLYQYVMLLFSLIAFVSGFVTQYAPFSLSCASSRNRCERHN